MKISTRGRYALRMMASIARAGGERVPVTLEAVSRETGISKKYLEQIAIPLKRAGLLVGVPGRGGGYRLARPPQAIDLATVVEAALGPIGIVGCVMDPGSCDRAGECEARMIYALATRAMRDVFAAHTVEDLVRPRRLREALLALAASSRDTRVG
ncbi:MAG: Rrf2 family transcriptional regulator [Acidobacteriota bacterium]|nr:Rrf2 family transcriptional regulator [Acidobacteriota bacterium]